MNCIITKVWDLSNVDYKSWFEVPILDTGDAILT